MEVLLAIVAVTLGSAGVAKLLDPLGAREMLRRIGVGVPAPVVRVAGVAELGVAVVTVAVGGRLPAAVLASAHVVFLAVVAASLRVGDVGCGCFGTRSTAPPRGVHLAANVASLAVATAAVVSPVRPVDVVTGATVAEAVAAMGLVAAGSWLLVVVYTDGAELADALRRRSARVEVGP